jgi:NADH:ubiquinone oxidoreductase subunit F (NADH-binding)
MTLKLLDPIKNSGLGGRFGFAKPAKFQFTPKRNKEKSF